MFRFEYVSDDRDRAEVRVEHNLGILGITPKSTRGNQADVEGPNAVAYDYFETEL